MRRGSLPYVHTDVKSFDRVFKLKIAWSAGDFFYIYIRFYCLITVTFHFTPFSTFQESGGLIPGLLTCEASALPLSYDPTIAADP